MSYASRLVAMTRPAAPPRGGLQEIAETKEVSAEHGPAPLPGAPAGGEQRTREPERETRQGRAEPPARRPDTAAVRAPESGRDRAIVREAASTPAEMPPVSSSHRNAQEPDWLTDEPNAHDPLEAIAASDEVRELLRSVRAWTRTGPVAAALPGDDHEQLAVDVPPLEPRGATSMHADTAAFGPAQPAERRDDPVQVSIGNVMITVEDAPAAPSSREAPARTAMDPSSRLARHYLRGV